MQNLDFLFPAVDPNYEHLFGPSMMPQIPQMPTPAPMPMPPFAQLPQPGPSEGLMAQLPPATMAPNPWTVAGDKLRSDRGLQLALMNFGLTALQDRAPGQSSMSQIAKAGQAGVGSYLAYDQQEKQRQLQERQLSQTDRRIDLDESRVGLEERRVAEGEQTGAVQRQVATDENERKKRLFPKTLEKVDQEIEKLKTGGQVDEAQAKLLSEKARLYPQEVRAALMNAQANLKRAGKPGGVMEILDATAEAMVKSGKAESVDAARAELGAEYFSKRSGSGSSPAAVQTADEYMETWKGANPKRQGETDEQYNQRASAAKEAFMTTKKKDDYASGLAKHLADNALIHQGDPAKMKIISDSYAYAQQEAAKRQPGGPAPEAPKAEPRKAVKRSEIEATAKARGVPAKQIEEALKKRGVKIED